ncbi:indolepyruvate ferredoxin oxidoreductase family protein [Actinocorallia sp. A-T 12471]|uniref:indolepyruvate ferredoxin oxidoreductase family protein n=1 Tax=Actinocorallia sp. A-T 12471 TaxID=3089813 RepID=UPI0029CD269C|nr:indolepyruvate ferredoxin oxidoreductase family protein [Actinocorallia sp. A-T 12471]MDX6745129.1 indolepyruvate ferredoxin oxidoreductase family protein [Actinocorallia sp. A-T 12471]
MTAVLSGVDALVRLLVLRRLLDERDGLKTATMVSGYPGSPLGTFDLAVDALGPALAANRITHRPGLNEELAAAIVWGSQMGAAVPYDGIDGVAGVWYGKGPGLDRSGDALKHANAMGAGPHGGAVMFCGDDPAAKSSTLACDSQFAFQDACVPVLVPADQQDILDLGIHAFRMSRYAGSWVGLRVVTAVADGVGTVDPEPGRHTPRDPEGFVVDGEPWRHVPQRTIGPHAVPGQEALIADHRLRAARAYARHNRLDRVSGAASGARLGVVCSGKTYFDLLQAFADLGTTPERLGVRVLKLGMVFPLVEETVLEFAGSVAEIAVIEEKRPFVETQLRAVLHEAGVAVPVRGKRDAGGRALVPVAGELDAGSVADVLVRLLPEAAPEPVRRPGLPLLQVAGRAPGYCSGCPHNRSTVVPEGALAGGGVGCHGILYFEARQEALRRLPPTPMGAEGVPWIGLAPYVAEPHLIQNLGDGTLSHSGTLAIRAAVAANAPVTFKILYNAAVAMTGGQDVTGLLDVPALTRALEAEGVRKIVVCAEEPGRYGRRARWARGVEVKHRDALADVQERLRREPGVTVIVYDQRCAAEARRLRKRGLLPEPPRRVVINEAVCEGCGDCGAKSNCLSVLPVETEFGTKRQIHDPSCNRDYTCLDGDCPSFVTLKPARRGRRRARADARPTLPQGHLPTPEPAPIDGRFGVYFTGIGGTGVITAVRVLARAAEAAGLAVGGMDQTGLSQKAGAVVSHLHLAADRSALGAAAVSARGADLYLSGDILQAASPAHLTKISRGRTLAVIDPTLTPTAAMLQHTNPTTPPPHHPNTPGPSTHRADAPGPPTHHADSSAPVVSREGSSAPAVLSDDASGAVVQSDDSTGPVVPRDDSSGSTVRRDGVAGGVVSREGSGVRVGDLGRAVVGEAGEGATVFVEARAIAERVFGDHMPANIVLLGAAFQRGGLPVPLTRIEAALGAGRGGEANLAAFAWGRWAVHDPEAVAAALASEASGGGLNDPSARALAVARPLLDGLGLPAELEGLLLRRAAQTVDYQDAARARRYLALVARTAAHDGAAEGWALTRAVAESWFKLLTYKDEYEVARLHLKADYDALAAGLGIEGPYKVVFHLHPPMLRRLGLKKKLPLGRPYELAFHVLRRMRRLRDTPFDVFAHDPDRKTERALILEYERLVADLLSGDLPYAERVALAASAEGVKGYGPLKEAAATAWRARVRA